jgi:hypothetical protein
MHELPVTHWARQQVAFNVVIILSKAFLQCIQSRLNGCPVFSTFYAIMNRSGFPGEYFA